MNNEIIVILGRKHYGKTHLAKHLIRDKSRRGRRKTKNADKNITIWDSIIGGKMNINLLSPLHLMEELQVRFPDTHINIELSWDIHRSGNKELTWNLYLSGDDANISQKFTNFPKLLSYANHLIAMQQNVKDEIPMFNFNQN